MIAITIIGSSFLIPFVIPTAVRMESNEKTIFNSVIWTIAFDNESFTGFSDSRETSASIFSKISCTHVKQEYST